MSFVFFILLYTAIVYIVYRQVKTHKKMSIAISIAVFPFFFIAYSLLYVEYFMNNNNTESEICEVDSTYDEVKMMHETMAKEAKEDSAFYFNLNDSILKTLSQDELHTTAINFFYYEHPFDSVTAEKYSLGKYPWFIKKRNKLFPLIRKYYVEKAKNELKKFNIKVSVSGRRNEYISFQGEYFSSKEIISKFHNDVKITLGEMNYAGCYYHLYNTDEIVYMAVESQNKD